eukprot:m.120877 g.120877  ORF g.120877 m.120877 type:complete len:666 (+) comp14374_c2_seq1:79-2076(+)
MKVPCCKKRDRISPVELETDMAEETPSCWDRWVKRTRKEDPHPVVTKKELRSWYMYDWANSVFYQVVIGSYLPLLLQSVALENAGYPNNCPNYFPNSPNISRQVFNETNDTVSFFIDNVQTGKSSCLTTCNEFNGSTYCEGKPEVTTECLDPTGYEQYDLFVTFLGTRMDPTEYATLFISFSVLGQAIAFISVGSLGDYGENRKLYLVICTILGSFTCILCIAVTAETWYLGGIFMFISNIFFGVCIVLYNAWLPLLARCHEDVLKASDEEYEDTLDRITGHISGWGYVIGYAGSLTLLALTAPFILASDSLFGSLEGAFRINVALAGVWWFVFSLYTFKNLENRPGQPLPAEAKTYIGWSWYQTYLTVRRMFELPVTFKFIVLWFFYSDGAFVISSIGVLMANTVLDWGCTPKEVGVGVLLFAIPIFAILGNVLADYVSSKYNVSSKAIVIATLLWTAVVPVWGLIGYASDDFGIRKGWEVFLIGPYYGFGMGALQSYSRSLFADIIPKGFESQFFLFYEITNKGSSWLGPLVVALLLRHGDDETIRLAFIYVLVMILVPTFFLYFLDLHKGRLEAIAYHEAHFTEGELTEKVDRKRIGTGTAMVSSNKTDDFVQDAADTSGETSSDTKDVNNTFTNDDNVSDNVENVVSDNVENPEDFGELEF